MPLSLRHWANCHHPSALSPSVRCRDRDALLPFAVRRGDHQRAAVPGRSLTCSRASRADALPSARRPLAVVAVARDRHPCHTVAFVSAPGTRITRRPLSRFVVLVSVAAHGARDILEPHAGISRAALGAAARCHRDLGLVNDPVIIVRCSSRAATSPASHRLLQVAVANRPHFPSARASTSPQPRTDQTRESPVCRRRTKRPSRAGRYRSVRVPRVLRVVRVIRDLDDHAPIARRQNA